MVLNGVNNQKVVLEVKGTQFPDAKPASSDSEWLNICIDVQSNLGNWQTIDPSLTISEFEELIQWFRDLSQNKQVEYTELYFIEPNLEFDLINEKDENGLKRIKLVFEAESKPKFAQEDKDYFIDFYLSNEQLAEIANELENELSKYKE